MDYLSLSADKSFKLKPLLFFLQLQWGDLGFSHTIYSKINIGTCIFPRDGYFSLANICFTPTALS